MAINNTIGIEVKKRLQDISDIKQESGESVARSLEAKTNADEAKHRSDITKKQLDEALKDGDQVVEVQTLRVDPVTGEVYGTAADRFEANQWGVKLDLEQAETDINERGVNVMKYGLLGNGTENIVPYIEQAFTESNHVVVPRNNVFLLNEPLIIPEGKTVDFSKSQIRYNHESASIEISPNTIVENLRIQVPGTLLLTRAAIIFDGNKLYQFGHNTRTIVNNLFGEQQAGQYAYENDFIHFKAEQVNNVRCNVSGVMINNVNSTRFKHALRNTVVKTSDEVACYITGNIISNWIAYNPKRFIWDDDVAGGGEIGGNIYDNVQCQPADNQEKTFYRLVGNGNNITGKFWDVGRPSNKTDQFIILGDNNYIQAGQPAMPSSYIRNEGNYNTIIGGFPSAPAIHTNKMIVENQVNKLYGNVAKPLPFLLRRSESSISADMTPTVLYEEVIDPIDIPTSYTTITVKAMGERETPSSSYFGMRLNGQYLTGSNTHDVYQDAFWVEVKFSIRKYTDRISIKAFLKEEGTGVIQYRNMNISDLNNPFTLTVDFYSSSGSGDMVAQYVEATMTNG